MFLVWINDNPFVWYKFLKFVDVCIKLYAYVIITWTELYLSCIMLNIKMKTY